VAQFQGRRQPLAEGCAGRPSRSSVESRHPRSRAGASTKKIPACNGRPCRRSDRARSIPPSAGSAQGPSNAGARQYVGAVFHGRRAADPALLSSNACTAQIRSGGALATAAASLTRPLEVARRAGDAPRAAAGASFARPPRARASGRRRGPARVPQETEPRGGSVSYQRVRRATGCAGRDFSQRPDRRDGQSGSLHRAILRQRQRRVEHPPTTSRVRTLHRPTSSGTSHAPGSPSECCWQRVPAKSLVGNGVLDHVVAGLRQWNSGGVSVGHHFEYRPTPKTRTRARGTRFPPLAPAHPAISALASTLWRQQPVLPYRHASVRVGTRSHSRSELAQGYACRPGRP
jgi:hypothetical protein